MSLTEFDAGWIHDLGAFSVASVFDGIQREVALRECEAFWHGLFLSLGCAWINTPEAIRTASYKLYQLTAARTLGIPAPDYIVTNNPDSARSFVRHKRSIIVKALSSAYIVYPSGQLKLYTRRLADISDAVLRSLSHGPLIFQEEIEKEYEIRIVILDDKCFSLAIDCRDIPGSPVDIRQMNFDEEKWRFRPGVGVEQIEDWSKKLVATLGLSYGALDWLVDPQGRPFFLECNPLGAFKWSELCGEFNITEEIAAALCRRAQLNAITGT
jgi:glutathione synthase/RimK-type ligase-like ATP-grasp enzyme